MVVNASHIELVVPAGRGGDHDDDPDMVSYGFDGIGQYLGQISKVALLTVQEEVELAKRIEAGLFSSHHLKKMREAGVALPLFLRQDLMWVERDGRRAKMHLIEANLRLVVYLAKRHQHRGLDLLDLVQHGNLGLLRAVEKFDYKKGHKFSTYATWWIRQAIVRGLYNEARAIRLPVHIEETLAKVNRAEVAVAVDRGSQGEASMAIVAADVGVSEDEINELKSIARRVFSLEWLVYDSGKHYADLVDENEVTAIDVVSYSLLCDQLQSVFETLSDREATIIRLRNGIEHGPPMERDEVAQMYGVTSERIRQIETEAMKKLRHPSRSQVLRDYV